MKLFFLTEELGFSENVQVIWRRLPGL